MASSAGSKCRSILTASHRPDRRHPGAKLAAGGFTQAKARLAPTSERAGRGDTRVLEEPDPGGLVSIPVEIFAATKAGPAINLRQIHEPSGKPIANEKVVANIGRLGAVEIQD